MRDPAHLVLLSFFFILLSACGQNRSTLNPQPLSEEPVTMPAVDSPLPAEAWWRPVPGLTWQWQLSEPPVDTSVEADVYDIDLFDNDAAVIEELHAQGRKVICYISVGSWEDWRPDAEQFPPAVLGNDYEGWPGERWLDIRRIDLLAPIMRLRLDLCAAKGFDGVEPDNIEIYDNNTGFPLTYEDQLAYAKWLADEAHARGLAIGLKNAPNMLVDSLSLFDFAITEDAYYYEWAEEMLPFIEAGKPVFAAEYTDMEVDFDAACNCGRLHNVSFILKNRILTAFRVSCP
jgi:endo-alpha-1,4-polygalactosaminidase (GH114 family)